MSRYHTNLRYPTLSQSLSSYQNSASINATRSPYTYRPWFSRYRRRVHPDNRGPFRHNTLRTLEFNVQRETDPETDFEKSFDKFFKRCCFLQSILLWLFFILVVFTQIFEGNFEAAVYCCIAPIGILLIYLLHFQMKARTKRQKRKMGYHILEMIVIILFLATIRDGTVNNSFIVFSSILLANYIARMVDSYLNNYSGLVRFTNQVNLLLFLVRTIIFSQGVFALVQLSLDSPLSWFIVFIPIWIIILIILVLTYKVIKSIFFTHRLIFWNSDLLEKKRGAFWIFGNIFALICLSLWGFIFASFVFEDESEWDRPFLSLFIIICAWCFVSLSFSRALRDDIHKVCQELATLSNTGDKVIMEMIDLLKEKEKECLEEEKKRQEQVIKYFVKVSSSYFKPVTQQEMKLLKYQSTPKKISEDIEAETNTQQGEVKCIICFSYLPDAVLMDCGHGGICFECAQEVNKAHQECHMCRQKIKRLFKINLRNNKKDFYKIINEIKNKDDEP